MPRRHLCDELIWQRRAPRSFLVCTLLTAVLAATLGACSDSPAEVADGQPPTVDAAPAPDAGACTTHHATTCYLKNVFWVDSCDKVEELKQVCGSKTSCLEGLCCETAQTAGAFKLPAHTIWIKWTFVDEAIDKLEFPIKILSDPGDGVGLYMAPFNGQIDGTNFYLGLQTTIHKPSVGRVGKGLIFSRWKTQSADDLRIAPGGFSQVSDHEGEFVGVRLEYAWTTGDYTVRLQRAESDGARDWFDLYIKDAAGKETFIGGLRFPRLVSAVPASIKRVGTTFTEVYWNADDYGAVPAWHTAIMARANNKAPLAAVISYPAWPTAQFPNADAYLDPATKLIHLIYGGATRRCHVPGSVIK
jgi:hypothetical protein